MAYPIWLTPAGNLGIVPELEYYQLQLDAYDETGGTLVYTKVSGTLPTGIQLVQSLGVLQGIPISTGNSNQNQTYTFTIRVQNISVDQNSIADRTFNLTITNISPPIIVPPPPFDLGTYFDGTQLSLQLQTQTQDLSLISNTTLTWSIKTGTLPPGLSLTSTGLLSGYIKPIPAQGPTSNPGWDEDPWDEVYSLNAGTTIDYLGWDFPLGTTSKNFVWTVEVTDGVNSNLATYKMLVFPRAYFTADSSLILVSNTIADGTTLSVDTSSRHFPIILSTQSSIVPERQGGWFSFQVEAIDIDGDVLQYAVPALDQGTFDEQPSAGNGIPYIPATLSNGYLYAGVFPQITPAIVNGNTIVTVNTTAPELVSGSVVQILYPNPSTSLDTLSWNQGTVNGKTIIQLTGNTIISNVGNVLTQNTYTNGTWSNVNASISNITATTGTLSVAGNSLVGTLTLGGGVLSANVGQYITQSSTGANAIINANVLYTISVPVTFLGNTFNLGATAGNLKLNGANIAVYPTAVSANALPRIFSANVGDIITQPSTGATATVLTAQPAGTSVQVSYNSGSFAVNTGNLLLNGSNINVYPISVVAQAQANITYNSGALIYNSASFAYINAANTYAIPTSAIAVGVDVGALTTQGSVGYDDGKFDQGTLAIPGNLKVDINSGWIYGNLPVITATETNYNFDIQVYKRDYLGYVSTRQFTLEVLGSLDNSVSWVTPSNLGTIENGAVSDLSITAVSSVGKNIYYQYTPGGRINLPQGLQLLPDGLISGKTSFEVFSIDAGLTTFDVQNASLMVVPAVTTFDHTFSFDVTAYTFDGTASAEQTFTIVINETNIKPYEDLYLKAYMTQYQRSKFQNIMQDQSVFSPGLIYRANDPWFGLATDVTTLFLAGLNPSTLSKYALAINTNHFGKRLLFGAVKSAVARTNDVYDVIENATGTTIGTYNVLTNIFIPNAVNLGYVIGNGVPTGTTVGQQHIKYEVVYAEVLEENAPANGGSNADSINLSGIIANPYYDAAGNAFVIATPNSFSNMDDAVVNTLGYANQGALPDWMTSIQNNGKQLGFTRGVVLAYVEPGAGETVVWRFQQKDYDLNELNFTVDRYLLDNTYTANYDLSEDILTLSDAIRANIGDIVTQNNSIQTGTVSNSVINSVKLTVGNLSEIGGFNLTLGILGNILLNGIDTKTYPISSTNSFYTSTETTFDRYPPLRNEFSSAGTVNYAVSIPFEDINERSITAIIADGGLDGITNFVDGQTLVFYQQEFVTGSDISNSYNQGWANSTAPWDSSDISVNGEWDYSGDTGWDASTYVPGYIEWLDNRKVVNGVITYPVTNQRAGIWKININSANFVTLTFVQQMNYYKTLYITSGFARGGTTIFYDPVIKSGLNFPNYSIIPQQLQSPTEGTVTLSLANSNTSSTGSTVIGTYRRGVGFIPNATGFELGYFANTAIPFGTQVSTLSTIFDGDGTKFYNHRDHYIVPEQGDSLILFPHTNVFD